MLQSKIDHYVALGPFTRYLPRHGSVGAPAKRGVSMVRDGGG